MGSKAADPGTQFHRSQCETHGSADSYRVYTESRISRIASTRSLHHRGPATDPHLDRRRRRRRAGAEAAAAGAARPQEDRAGLQGRPVQRDLRRMQPRRRAAGRGLARRRLRRLPLALLEVPLPHRRGRARLRGRSGSGRTKSVSRTAASWSTRRPVRSEAASRTRRIPWRGRRSASRARSACWESRPRR